MMKLAAALMALSIVGPAEAQQYNTQRDGNMTFTNGSNGYNSTEQRFGGMTFGHDNQGNSWNTMNFGNQTFTNGTGPAFGFGNK